MANRVVIKIDLESKDAQRAIQGLERAFQNAEDSAKDIAPSLTRATRSAGRLSSSLKKVGTSLIRIGTVATGLGTTLAGVLGGAIIKEAVEASSAIEDLTTQFVAFTGSAESAAEQVRELQEFTAATPFRLDEVAQAGRTLLAFGESQELVTDRLRILGNVAAGTGSDLGELTTVFGQIQAQGRLTGERFNQLIERGVNIGPALADSLGVAESEIRDLISAGRVSAEEVTKAFNTIAGEGGQFAGSLERLSQTASGLLSTLRDNINLALAGLGESFSPIIKEALNFLTEITQEVSGFIQANQQELAGGFRDIVIDVVNTLQGLTRAFARNFVTIAGFFDTLSGIGTAAFKGLQQVIDTFILGLTRAVQGITRVGAAAAEFLGQDDLANSLRSFEEAAKSTGDSVADDIKDRSTEIKDALVDAFTTDNAEIEFAAKVTSTLNTTADRIESFKDRINSLEFEPKVTAQLETTTTSNSDGLTSSLRSEFDALAASIRPILSSLADGLANIASDLASTFVQGTQQTRANLDAIETKEEQINNKRIEAARLSGQERVKAEQELVELEREKRELTKKQRDDVKEAAADSVAGVAGAITDVFLPGAGQFITALLEVARDPEAFKAFIEGFVEAIPAIIEAISAALPDVILILIENMPRVAEALIAGIFKLSGRLIEIFGKILISGATSFIFAVLRELNRIFDPIVDKLGFVFEPFITVVNVLKDAFRSFSAVLESFDLGGGGGTLGKLASGDIGGALSDVGGALGLATGGFVTGSGNRDTVPAMLTPGELVVDRTTGPALRDFLQSPAAQGQSSQDLSNVESLLSQLLTAVGAPQMVETSINVDGNRLADAIVELKRNGQLPSGA